MVYHEKEIPGEVLIFTAGTFPLLVYIVALEEDLFDGIICMEIMITRANKEKYIATKDKYIIS